jgi:hypothetical protein
MNERRSVLVVWRGVHVHSIKKILSLMAIA